MSPAEDFAGFVVTGSYVGSLALPGLARSPQRAQIIDAAMIYE